MLDKLKQLLKNTFTFKNIFACFISAIGYGFGFYIPYNAGSSYAFSFVICIIVGLVFDYIAEKVLETDMFKDDEAPKLKLGIAIYLIYLLFWAISYFTLGHDLDADLFVALKYMVAIQFGGFFLNLVLTYLKKHFKSKKSS